MKNLAKVLCSMAVLSVVESTYVCGMKHPISNECLQNALKAVVVGDEYHNDFSYPYPSLSLQKSYKEDILKCLTGLEKEPMPGSEPVKVLSGDIFFFKEDSIIKRLREYIKESEDKMAVLLKGFEYKHKPMPTMDITRLAYAGYPYSLIRSVFENCQCCH